MLVPSPDERTGSENDIDGRGSLLSRRLGVLPLTITDGCGGKGFVNDTGAVGLLVLGWAANMGDETVRGDA